MKSKHLLVLLPAAAIAGVVFGQGSLAPNGAPAPAMKTLDQIEPRTPISSLPYLITQPGSYYLTRNLEASPATGGGNGAISIQTGNVTLDLNSFTLSSTAAIVNQSAITVGNVVPAPRSIRITNGTIRGTTTVVTSGDFPARSWVVTPGGFRHGIDATSGLACEFCHLTIIGCRFEGLQAGRGSRIHHVTAEQNGGRGIQLTFGTEAEVSHCLAWLNGADGIYTNGAAVSHCRSSTNGRDGISAQSGAVAHCVSTDNFINGIDVSAGAVSHCVAKENGSDGIRGGLVTAFCTASLNNRRNNGSEDIDGANSRTGNSPAP